MIIEKNTPQLWDRLWREITAQELLQIMSREKKGVRWKRLETAILEKFGTFEGLRAIEIGAGLGTNAALFAVNGAEVTVLDYSDQALCRSRELFNEAGVEGIFIKHDALALPLKLLGEYDVSMSFGLTEHFLGDDRLRIYKAHLDLVKPGGLVAISAPNKYCPPYRIMRYLARQLRYWMVGEEYPYSRRELRDICNKLKVDEYFFFGDSFISSLELINPIAFIKKRGGLKVRKSWGSLASWPRGTFLDDYLSRSIILCVHIRR